MSLTDKSREQEKRYGYKSTTNSSNSDRVRATQERKEGKRS